MGTLITLLTLALSVWAAVYLVRNVLGQLRGKCSCGCTKCDDCITGCEKCGRKM